MTGDTGINVTRVLSNSMVRDVKEVNVADDGKFQSRAHLQRDLDRSTVGKGQRVYWMETSFGAGLLCSQSVEGGFRNTTASFQLREYHASMDLGSGIKSMKN